MSKNNNKYDKYPVIAIIIAFLLLITLFTPFAIPVDRGIDSKEALSFVWIWGLCYGQGEFFFLIMPMGFFLILFAILIVICSFELKKHKLSLVKFGERVFIFSFLIFIISFVLMAIIEYSFLYFPNVPTMGLGKADFWSYHLPGFGYIGVFFISYFFLNVSLALMGYGRSNFFNFAMSLFIVTTFILLLISIDVLFISIFH
jgi:hypothetical protein